MVFELSNEQAQEISDESLKNVHCLADLSLGHLLPGVRGYSWTC